MKFFLHIIIFIFCTYLVRADTNIKGKVLEKITREPIELAVVSDGQKGNTVLTDKEGNFVFPNPKGDILYIMRIGYRPQQVSIGANHSLCLYVELEKTTINLKDITINGGSSIATLKSLSSLDLNMQPAKSAQDLLKLVPGLFIAQHQGGGKAEQIFLRGFDADHGTDVYLSVDGMPVNMVSHAHGQGYADLHFMIPETVSSYEFGKGPYYTDKGDFTTAGYVAYNTKNVLDQNMFKLEVGQFNTRRALLMFNLLGTKARIKGQSAYIAVEDLYSDGGPFNLQEHFKRFNLFGRYNMNVGKSSRLHISASNLTSTWRSAGELPNRTVSEGYISSRFGALDSAQGGITNRTNVNIRLTTSLKNNWTIENQAWYSHYNFSLITNFTFYYYFPTQGDEFRQQDARDVTGYNTKFSRQSIMGNTSFTSSFGAGYRFDNVYLIELDHTMHGNFLSYAQYGSTKELNTNAYYDETIKTGPWLFNAGVRLDYFHFNYVNKAPQSDTFASKIYTGVNPNQQKALVSPKLNIQYTINSQLQVYFKAGKGFHSNDARVAIGNQGIDVIPAAYGSDLGINWKPVPNLFINTAIWYLYLKQEFTFGQDLIAQPGGPIGPSGATERKGIDFSARYQITHWLFANVNINYAHPRYIDSAKGKDYVALAPTLTSTASLTFRLNNGINGGISYRYLHDRSANGDYTLTAQGYFITDLAVNYTRKKYEVGISIENLFNRAWSESQFEYTSQLKGESKPVDEVSYTPGVPFFAKAKATIFF